MQEKFSGTKKEDPKISGIKEESTKIESCQNSQPFMGDFGGPQEKLSGNKTEEQKTLEIKTEPDLETNKKTEQLQNPQPFKGAFGALQEKFSGNKKEEPKNPEVKKDIETNKKAEQFQNPQSFKGAFGALQEKFSGNKKEEPKNPEVKKDIETNKKAEQFQNPQSFKGAFGALQEKFSGNKKEEPKTQESIPKMINEKPKTIEQINPSQKETISQQPPSYMNVVQKHNDKFPENSEQQPKIEQPPQKDDIKKEIPNQIPTTPGTFNKNKDMFEKKQKEEPKPTSFQPQFKKEEQKIPEQKPQSNFQNILQSFPQKQEPNPPRKITFVPNPSNVKQEENRARKNCILPKSQFQFPSNQNKPKTIWDELNDQQSPSKPQKEPPKNSFEQKKDLLGPRMMMMMPIPGMMMGMKPKPPVNENQDDEEERDVVPDFDPQKNQEEKLLAKPVRKVRARTLANKNFSG